MAITGTKRPGDSVAQFATGAFQDTGTIKKTAIHLGWKPRYVRLINLTDRDEWEWFADGTANGTTLKTVAAGTRTLDTADDMIYAVDGYNLGTVDTWQLYDVTTYSVGVPGTSPAEDTDSSRLNVAQEVISGFYIPVGALEASKQYAWQAFR